MARLVLIDYGSGNLHSAERALQLAARSIGSAISIIVTDDPDVVRGADRLVLPGVGHFADCVAALHKRDGLRDAMTEAVQVHGRPFLGICVGMQLMASVGEEGKTTTGLDWIPGRVAPLAAPPGHRLPHMGWNEIVDTSGHPVLSGLPPAAHAYFVHSFAFSPDSAGDIAAESEHGVRFAAAVAKHTVFGTQFHPEKSQAVGQILLRNFLTWAP